MRLKLNPPSVLSATGTVLPTLNRYVRKRLPNSSKDKLGSQHAAPRLSLFAMILVAQVAPPSRLTAANIPAAGTTTLVTITILFGLVGLTAIVSSDSLLESWLTSMFVGVAGEAACSGKATKLTANPSRTKGEKAGFFDFIEIPRLILSVAKKMLWPKRCGCQVCQLVGWLGLGTVNPTTRSRALWILVRPLASN